MYKLLRRISSSFKERFDWRGEDGATSSTTPQIGSKRRMSDDDDVPNGSLSKRSRAHDNHDEASELGELRRDENGSETATPTQEESRASSTAPGLPRKDTEEVRRVTKGVKEIELEDKKGKGKEVPEETSEDGVKVEETTKESENAPSDEPESDETPEAKKVADDESSSDDAEGTPEPSKEDAPAAVSVVDEPSEAPSVSNADLEEPADTVADETKPTTTDGTSAAVSPSDEEVDETPIGAEPVIKASNEATVKVQG